MKKISAYIAYPVSMLLGAVLTLVVMNQVASISFDNPLSDDNNDPNQTDQNKPLYWVAPMDPNFRRDKPGKSPMGMDLVPVYEDANTGQDAGPGTVSISPNVENNIGVRTGKAEFRHLSTEIKTVGYVQFDQDRLIHVHPRVEGWIEKLYVKSSGEKIQKGHPLYTLYSPQLVNAQEELILALNRQNQSMMKAAENRLSSLYLTDAFIASLKRSKKIQQNITFYAPQTGVVNNLKIREGFFVKPGTTLMSIGNLEEVWVEAEIFERQAVLVSEGIPVTMTLDYLPGQQWQGKVDYVYPTLDPKTRTARIRLRFSNPNRQLKPNMFAQVRIHTHSKTEKLMVPREAVIRTGEQDRVVLALGGGRYKSIAVTLGLLDHDYAEIIRGVEENEDVVTSAQFLLDSESSVSSDFKRMNNKKIPRAEVNGKVLAIDQKTRIATIERDPIKKWNRAATTMEFSIDRRLDLSEFTVPRKIRFVFEIINGNFIIKELIPMNSTDSALSDSKAKQGTHHHD